MGRGGGCGLDGSKGSLAPIILENSSKAGWRVSFLEEIRLLTRTNGPALCPRATSFLGSISQKNISSCFLHPRDLDRAWSFVFGRWLSGAGVGGGTGVGVGTGVGIGTRVGVVRGVGIDTGVGVDAGVDTSMGVGIGTHVGVGTGVDVGTGV